MKESIRVEDRSLKIYDAKNGEPLMEDITLTDFSEFTKE
jgi:hypothetical protein